MVIDASCSQRCMQVKAGRWLMLAAQWEARRVYIWNKYKCGRDEASVALRGDKVREQLESVKSGDIATRPLV